MAVTADVRAALRAAFGGRCGHCGVAESSVGGELEVDHFHPQAAGGSDDAKNLVYACTGCNRFKGDYACAPDAPESLRLLQPGVDDLTTHIFEQPHGDLVGLSARGWFHIQRLHLNRPQLVEMRRLHRVMREQRVELSRTREAEAHLRAENERLQDEISRLRAALAELLRGK